jgi:uncharacterized protein
MKASKYNIIFDDVLKNKYLVFNSLTESLVVLNKKYFNDINIFRTYKQNQIETQLSFNVELLLNGGFIIDNNFSEDSYLKLNVNNFNYHNDTLFLILIPTLNCNFDCVYCKEMKRDETYSEDDIARIINYVESSMKNKKNLEIEWYGGEPLLEIETIKKLTKSFKKICEDNKSFYSASICTNGSLFNEDIINKLKDLSIYYIQITVDGPKNTHEMLRPMKNGKESFDLIFKNISEIVMKNNNIFIRLRVNISDDNIDLIKDLFLYIPDNIKSKIQLYFRYIFSSKSKNYKEFNKSFNWKKYWGLYIDSLDYGLNSFDPCSSFFNNKKYFFYCYETERYSSMYIAPKCLLFKCSQSFSIDESFGQLMKDGRIHYHNYKNYIDFCSVETIDRASCKRCLYLPLHFGGCRYIYLKYNKSCHPDFKAYYKEMINYYYLYFKKRFAPGLNDFDYLVVKLNKHVFQDIL